MAVLQKVAYILVALFVLVSGIATLLILAGQAGLGVQLSWATGILGVLGGLAWLTTAVTGKRK